jgi:hypothetical protein
MMHRSAVFSADRTYRYALYRLWLHEKPKLLVVGLNCSTADENYDDPTIRRCIGFADTLGFGGLIMANAFAYRATDPKVMKAAEDPIGPENDWWIRTLDDKAGMTIIAWGIHGGYMDRDKAVLGLIKKPMCFGVTKDGYPRHPLYLKKDTKPIEYG